ncbi:MAG TPA: Uma2 family endonuclease [Armatimonadota bacterium]|nr:Uma2 family endonuclease [Armatimonadota bacterium]
MTVVERTLSVVEPDLRELVRGLQPGESCSLDRPVTVEEFCELDEEDGNLELVNGVIYMVPPPTDAHEDAYGWLFKVIGQYVEARALGKVRGSRSGVRVSPTSLPEPDLLFFRTEHLDRLKPSGVHGPPDFAIEIDDSNRARLDAVRKQSQYADAGVTELWVVDLPRRELRHFLLEEGVYRRLEVDPEGEVEARTVEGLRLTVAWLFQGPGFPSSLEVVTALLAR